MEIAVAIFAVAYAALCVWLTVRIVNRRERWAKWTLAAVFVGLPLLYVLGFGPACWWLSEMPKSVAPDGIPIRHAPWIYWPIGTAANDLPRPIGRAIRWYAELGLGNDAISFGQEIFWKGYDGVLE
ncbi:MAG TPA: hypothetical protein VGM05_21130 [Planctomycetaceae bacterium]|jgi:hypothetical protein